MSKGSVDKVVVLNQAALTAKYGAAAPTIDAAITTLIAADMARGLRTQRIRIDDAADMAAVSGAPVIATGDDQGAKAAIDAIYAALAPDYIFLLDGPDIVPHIKLDPIPGLTDADQAIPSDLPYACAAPFSRRAADFVGPERVVGRLPAAEGAADAALLVSLLQHAAAHVPQPRSQYANYFGISADAWSVSTQLSLAAAFQDHAKLQTAPTATHPAIDEMFGQASHFINCHGADTNPQFYGEKEGAFPVAMRSKPIAARANGAATIVTAECCYGAQLYNHTLGAIDEPICIAYLRSGAAAYVGATNIAYGPDASSGQADLLCQYFWAALLAGASTGRAMLQARQAFVRTQLMSNPANLKTIAQFLLLGDPAVTPVQTPPAAPVDPAMAKTLDLSAAARAQDYEAAKAIDAAAERGQRKQRRQALASEGRSLGNAASVPGRPAKEDSPAWTRLRDLAMSRGYAEPVAFEVTGGAEFRRSVKALGQKRRIVVAVARHPKPPAGAPPLAFTRVFVGSIVDGTIIRQRMRESMMTPKQIEISGRVRKAMVNVGSKSEHTAVLLDADDGHSYELRMPSQNPFEISPHLTDLVGEHLTTSGVASNGTLLMHEWRVSGKGK